MSESEDRIYIAEMAELLDHRAEHTIRQWLKRPDFPAELEPSREGGRQRLYWVRDQVDGMKKYAAERDVNRGTWGRTPA